MSDSRTSTQDEFFGALLGDFLDESSQLLDTLNENLLRLDEWVQSTDGDRRCDDALINEMFRSAHSLKGLSAMLGLTDINRLTHKIENVFDAARKDELAINAEVVELVFRAVDCLVGLVDALKDPDAEAVDGETVVEDIVRLLQSAGAERGQGSHADAEQTLRDAHESMGEEVPQVPADDPPADPGDVAPVVKTPQPESIAPKSASIDVDAFEGLEDEAEVSAKYLAVFVDETEQTLDSLTETYLALEGGGTREQIESLLVLSHRIKGSAASVGLNRAAKFAHVMEDLLQDVVETGGVLSSPLTDAMLQGVDALRRYIANLKQGLRENDRFAEMAGLLIRARDGAADAPTPSATPEPRAPQMSDVIESSPEGIPDALRQRVLAAAPAGVRIVVGTATFQPGLLLVSLKARSLHEKLCGHGDVCYFEPTPETLDTLEDVDEVRFGVVTERPTQSIRAALSIAGVRTLTLEAMRVAIPGVDVAPETSTEDPSAASPRPSDASAPSTRPAEAKASTTRAPAPPPSNANKPTETLRVDVDRLDQLMNLAGELVISRARFNDVGDRLKKVFGNRHTMRALGDVLAELGKMAKSAGDENDPNAFRAELDAVWNQVRHIQANLEPVRGEVESLARAGASINELGESIHQLHRVTEGIQQGVMGMRMIPIGPLFARFKRVVRDITRSNGKRVHLIINGEKTELDKRMIDELGDPLIHMVRNAADHGIESAEDRRAAGKSDEGTIVLDASQRGNSIVIQVIDDGKGLDVDRILRKALEKGVVSEADAERMTPRQIYQLIWEPGLSTAAKVTEISGRGVGMDIVKSKIEELNGTVDLESVPGRGTTVTIKLPLTLAILPSLMVGVDGDVFALPIESVVEIVNVDREDLVTVFGRQTACVRGRVLSVVQLRDVFSWNQEGDRATRPQDDQCTLVITGESGHEIGLAVDRVIGEEDVVIRSMAENYKDVPGIAGASILGNGRVSLILDVPALCGMASDTVSASSQDS